MAGVTEFLKNTRTLARRVVKWRQIFIGCSIAGVVFGLAFGRFAAPQYSSYMIVNAVQSSAIGSLSGGLASLASSPAASLLGISGVGGPQQFKSYLGLVQSQIVAQEFLKDPANVKLLFGDAVDNRGRWVSSPKRYVKRFLFALFGLSLTDVPTPADASLRLNRMIVVTTDTVNASSAKLSCTARHPSTCAQILNIVHSLADSRLRQLNLEQATEFSGYLNLAISRERIVEVRSALAQALVSAEKQIAMSSGDQPAAASIVEPPIVPMLPNFPKPTMMLLFGGLLGIVLGGATAWVLGDRKEFDLIPTKLRFRDLKRLFKRGLL